ncbi:MAG: hypothetical protein ACOCSE_01080 [Chitinivibrionales bacterium]
MEKLLSAFKALSDRNRMRVVSALLEYDELCACQVTELPLHATWVCSFPLSLLRAGNRGSGSITGFPRRKMSSCP